MIATASIATAALFGIVVLRWAGRRAEPPDGGRPDIWITRKVRYVHHDRELQLLRITAEEAALERMPFGIFRIGFAQRLTMRDARVDLLVLPRGRMNRPVASKRESPVHEPRRAVDRPKSAVAAIRMEGVSLRLRDPGGAWMKIGARRGEASLLDRGQIVLRGRVRVRSPRFTRTFSELVYDPRAARFVRARPLARARESAVASPPVLVELNAALAAVGRPDVETLRSYLLR